MSTNQRRTVISFSTSSEGTRITNEKKKNKKNSWGRIATVRLGA